MNHLVNMGKLRAMCAERGVSIAALERRTDIGNGVIARWAVNEPRLGNIKAVADFFGVSVDELIENKEDET